MLVFVYMYINIDYSGICYNEFGRNYSKICGIKFCYNELVLMVLMYNLLCYNKYFVLSLVVSKNDT